MPPTMHQTLLVFTADSNLITVSTLGERPDALLNIEVLITPDNDDAIAEVVAVISPVGNDTDKISLIYPSRHAEEQPFEVCAGIEGEPFDYTKQGELLYHLPWEGELSSFQYLIELLMRSRYRIGSPMPHE
jgi:hypothetical protein